MPSRQGNVVFPGENKQEYEKIAVFIEEDEVYEILPEENAGKQVYLFSKNNGND